MAEEVVECSITHEVECPITHEVMQHPVRAPDGHVYERSAIEAWLAHSGTSPITRKPMIAGELVPVGPRRASPHLCVSLVHPANSIRCEDDHVPMLAVVGIQSAGKSALLERITGLPVFPRDRGMCTRVPVRVCLRCGPSNRLPFMFERPVLKDDDACPQTDVARTAGSATGTSYDHLAVERACIRVRGRMEAVVQRKGMVLVEDVELCVVVYGPGFQNVDVVDLPGLVAAPVETRALSERLIQRYASRAGLVLVVHPATINAETDAALHLVTTDAHLRAKAVCVVTKSDSYLNEGEASDLLRLASSVSLGRGWFITMSKNVTGEASEANRLRVTSEKETAWLSEQFGAVESHGVSSLMRVVESWLVEDAILHRVVAAAGVEGATTTTTPRILVDDQDLTQLRNEHAAKETLLRFVYEMHGDVSSLGPNWGNMEVPLSTWCAWRHKERCAGVVGVDKNGLPTHVTLRVCSLRGRMSPQLCRLTTLVELDLSCNQITILPDCIDKLTNLTKLTLYDNKITILPDSIGNLTNLTKLSLFENKITSLPDSIGNLTNLTFLQLEHNQLTTLPDSISNLTNLAQLNLSRNHLTSFPDSICNLTNIVILCLTINHITTIPNSIGNLNKLRMLYLGYNNLTTVPDSIVKLWRLESFLLYGNHFSDDEKRRIRRMNTRVSFG